MATTGEQVAMIRLTIDGKEIEVQPGTTVLRAAEKAGITIPTLCAHPDLTPTGGCRMCLVEVKGARLPLSSCTLEATPGMVVETATPVLEDARRTILELLLSDYYEAQPAKSNGNPGAGSDTEFLRLVRSYGINPETFLAQEPKRVIDSDPNPFVLVDFNKCILCTRCIRACSEIQGRFVWGTTERGFKTYIIPGPGTDMIDAECESCGACVAYCPTGALDNKMAPVNGSVPDRLVSTICSYCGVGCQIVLNVKDEKIIRVTSHASAPVNGLHMCVKGRYGYDYVHHPDRITKPRVRKYLLEDSPRPNDRGEWVEVDWDTALDITARKIRFARDTHGSDSIGLLTSAKCLNEENYLMNKFARQVVGTNNIDHCARL
jgi:predicted molibdopterin-dependent oxidoreductase YjgC